jgi:hypothetical protein
MTRRVRCGARLQSYTAIAHLAGPPVCQQDGGQPDTQNSAAGTEQRTFHTVYYCIAVLAAWLVSRLLW